MPIRAVLFDAVGTLIYPDPPVAEAYAAAGHRFGVVLAEDHVRSKFRAAFAHQECIDRETGHRTSQAREVERWRQVVDFVFREAAPDRELRERVFAALWDHFAQPENWRAYEDVAECLQSLNRQGLIIGIASNFDERLVSIAPRLTPLDNVHHLFVSASIGYRKPAVEFFHSIERQLGVGPSELLSVGDDFENDIAGARAAGWHAVFLSRGLSTPFAAAATDVIESLCHLKL